MTDKGYHSHGTVLELETNGFRTYISEPDRGPQCWTDQHDARDAVYANRRRVRGGRGRRLLRRRGEYVERSFAHVYDTGGMRRTHLRGHANILKRLLLAEAQLRWQLLGVGRPPGASGNAGPAASKDVGRRPGT